MTLQSSGQISFADIQTIFGGTNPIGINEYYNDNASLYTKGVSGIPSTGSSISLQQFYGKSKYVWAPAVESTYSNFGLPWGLGNTSLMWLNGASGTNSSRSGGATFNNIGSSGQSRANFINYQNLILQAAPGDTLTFQMSISATANYFTLASLLINLGEGWFLVSAPHGNGSHTKSATYTIPATTEPGNYGIAIYCDYNNAASTTWSSANFYSLHVINTNFTSGYPNIEGKITNSTDRYMIFTTAGVDNTFTVPAGGLKCDILMIGGGGAGTGRQGGGAGACIVAINKTLPAGSCVVNVGAGGNNLLGGYDSFITVGGVDRYRAKGGGPGGYDGGNPNGGCGGGAAWARSTLGGVPVSTNVVTLNNNTTTTSGPTINNTQLYAVLGNKGGDNGAQYDAGGGGGIGSAGSNWSAGSGLNTISFNGTQYNFKTWFANGGTFGHNDNGYIGGGGGGWDDDQSSNQYDRPGGIGGGGGGGTYGGTVVPGATNTGSGGGGWNTSPGGSGIIIIRYRTIQYNIYTTNSSFTVPSGGLNCDILMIGAGGAGNYGGGGGAGACIVAINQTLPAGTCSVVVGDAPIGTNYYAKGGDSSISVAGTTRYLAKGGGPGGDVNKNGNDGGCGGGAGVINGTAKIYTGGNTELTNIVNGTTVGPGITSTYAVLGNPGGDQRDPDGVRPSGGYAFGAGGGGIGDVGQTTSDNSTTNGNGGVGLNAVTINGISYNFKSYFANNADFGYNGYIGGGGGGSDGSGTKVGINGLTGNANYNHQPPANTGSGGNGSWGYGSSGIVIIRVR